MNIAIDFTTSIPVSTLRPYAAKVLWIFRRDGYAWCERPAEIEIRSGMSGVRMTIDQRFAFNLEGLKEFYNSDKHSATLSGIPVEATRYNGGVQMEDGVYEYRLSDETIQELITDYSVFEN